MTDEIKSGGRAGKFGGGRGPGDPRGRRQAQMGRTTRDLTGPLKLDQHGRQTLSLSPKSGLFINEQGELDFNPSAAGVSTEQAGDQTFQTTIVAGGGGGGAGPPGPPGPAGPPGIDGRLGAPGSDGDSGEDGAPGPPGATGSTGPPGSAGGQGPIGPAGAVGEQGDPGDPGPPGPPGSVGATGSTGATGAQGATGPPGPGGDDGEPGEPGPPGGRGADGAAGAAGADGRPGPPGADGEGGGDECYTPTPVRFARDHDYTQGGSIEASDIRIATMVWRKRQCQVVTRMSKVQAAFELDTVGLFPPKLSGTGVSQTIVGNTSLVHRLLANAGIDSYRVIFGEGCVRLGYDVVACWIVQTGNVITNVRYWVGLADSLLNATSSPTVPAVAAFRYDTGPDGTAFWRCVTSDGAGGVTTTVTTTPIATSTPYRLMVQTTISEVTFWIDNVLVARHTATLPGNLTLGYNISVTTLDAANKRLDFARLFLMHSEFGF